MGSLLTRVGSVVGLHLGATYLFTYPAVHAIRSGVFGPPRGDRFQFVWIFWWMRESLVEQGRSPFFTALQYHPTGVSLALHDMSYFWGLLSVPLQAWAEPNAILNGFLLAALVLNGLAFYHLASLVTKDHWASLAGSLVFAYCPYLLGRFRVSHIQYLGVFFIPIFLSYLWRYRRDARPGYLAMAGLCAGLQSLISFYYGIALGLVFLAFVTAHVLRSRESWTSPRFWRRTLLGIAVTAAVAGAVALPAALPGLIEIQSGRFEAATAKADYQYLEGSSADLLGYALPDYTIARWMGWNLLPDLRRFAARLAESLEGNRAEKAVYPGWVGWAALIVVLAVPSARRSAWPWIALMLGFAILTLGPTLFVGGTPHLEGLLPGRLIHAVPLVNIVRGPSRFAPFVALGAGMLVAIACSQVRRRRGPGVAIAVACTCMLVTVLEFYPTPARISSIRRFASPFYEQLAADPELYTILNVPADFRGARGGADLYQYAQTIHHKRLVSGYVSREPSYVFETLNRSAFLQAIEHHRYDADDRLRLSEEGLLEMPRTLRELGVRYLIVHRSELGSQWTRVNDWLRRGPIEPIYRDHLIQAYRVREE